LRPSASLSEVHGAPTCEDWGTDPWWWSGGDCTPPGRGGEVGIGEYGARVCEEDERPDDDEYRSALESIDDGDE
jgi:hypothetical protein